MKYHPAVFVRFTFLLVLFLACSLHAKKTGTDRVTWNSTHFMLTIDRQKSFMLPHLGEVFERNLKKYRTFFSWAPDMTFSIVFLDEGDMANGLALASKGWVVIYLPGIDFKLRGSSNWLENVIAHELAHIITLRKMGVTRLFMYWGLYYERQFPSESAVHADLMYPIRDIPPWLAEGLAQYGAFIAGADDLDAHRRMVLRQALLHRGLLTLDQMNAFAWDSRGNEQIYNQGFFLVDYLYRKFGRDKMNLMMEYAAGMSVPGAFLRAFRKPPGQIYDEWKTEITSTFGKPDSADAPLKYLQPFPSRSPYIAEGSPVFSAKGDRAAYISSRRNDHGLTYLYLGKPGSAGSAIAENVGGRLKVHPSGDRFLYMRTRLQMSSGYKFSDLYECGFFSGKSRRLTTGLRIFSAAYNQEGRIFVLFESAGRTGWSELKASSLEDPRFPEGEWRDLATGPDAGSLYVVEVRGRQKNISILDINTGAVSSVLGSASDEKDPWYDGSRLFFSADYSGSHQIYSLNPDHSLSTYSIGAFSRFEPFVSGGALFSSTYCEKGFRNTGSALIELERRPPAFPESSGGPAAGANTSGLSGISPPPDTLLPGAMPSLTDTLSAAAPPFPENAPFASADTSSPHVGSVLTASAREKKAPEPYAPYPVLKDTIPLARSQWNQTKLELVGIGAMAGLRQLDDIPVEFQDGFGDITEDRITGLQFAEAAFSAFWMNPTLSTEVTALGVISQPVGRSETSPTVITGLDAVYREYLFDLIFSGVFQNVYLPPTEILEEKIEYSQVAIMSGLDYSLTDHLSAMPQFQYMGATEKQSDLTGAGLGLGGQVLYQFIDPGTDFINRGLVIQTGALAFPSGDGPLYAFPFALELFFHQWRTLFLNWGIQGVGVSGMDDANSLDMHFNHYIDIPLGVTLGPRGRFGWYFHKLFLLAGAGISEESGVSQSSFGSRQFRYQRHLPPMYHIGRGSGISPPFFSKDAYWTGTFGAALKTISLFNYPATWSFTASFPMEEGPKDPVWQILLSL